MRVGVADGWARAETPAGLQCALEWTPELAEYHLRLAILIADTDPNRAAAELWRALALKPSETRARIELGLRQEAGGDYAQAEQSLLRAASP